MATDPTAPATSWSDQRLHRALAALADASTAMRRAVDEAGLLAATAEGVTRAGAQFAAAAGIAKTAMGQMLGLMQAAGKSSGPK